MSSMLITHEDFDRMRVAMDKDGDGMVDKEEFKIAYKIVYDGDENDFEAAYDIVWKKIDKDGDGNLTVDELSAFYGFDKDGGTGEMSDDQILQALALGAELDAQKTSKDEPTKEEIQRVEKKGREARDTTIKIFNLEQKAMTSTDKTNGKEEPLSESNIKDMISMLELLSCANVLELKKTELKKTEEDNECVMKYLETPGVLARIEDQNGEMPLHKLARFVIPEDKPEAHISAFKLVFRTITTMMRNEIKDWHSDKHSDKYKQVAFVRDINKQDNKGKTPMFQAIEMNNILMVEMLNELDRDRPNSLLVTSTGWSVLHQAVHTDNFEIVKEVVRGLQKDGGRLRVLINLKDRSGRQPLHIAAYKCQSEDIIRYLMENGANGEQKDSGGLAPHVLAEKAGRRVSKEIIEEGIRRNSKEVMGGKRRASTSKEIMAIKAETNATGS